MKRFIASLLVLFSLVTFSGCFFGGGITQKIVKELEDVKYRVKADRIVAGTYLCAAAMTKGEIVLNGTPEEVFKEKEILKEAKLDILNSMKIIEGLNNIPNKEKVEEILWQLTYQK